MNKRNSLAGLGLAAGLLLSNQPTTMAQDAFFSSSAGPSSLSYDCTSTTVTGDVFSPQSSETRGKTNLSGSTEGTIGESEEMILERQNQSTLTGDNIAVRLDEFRKGCRIPDARILLGESMCDQSYRPIACDEVQAPKDLPPLPNQISLPREIEESSIRHDPVGSNSSVLKPLQFALPFNLNRTADRENSQPAEILVPASAVKALADANSEAANNPDFDCLFAAYCLQLQQTGQVKACLEVPIKLLRNAVGLEPNAWVTMAALKSAIAKIPANPAGAPERSRLADQLEAQGKLYDALVERLRCVDLVDDGMSRLHLAKLLIRLKERKLAYETLRDAAEKSWPRHQSQELSEVHSLMGEYIYFLAQEARKAGNTNLYMMRLRNASVCFRRCLFLDKYNRAAAETLGRIAREAICMDQSFDNHLLLGSVNLISGDLERADIAYSQCALINNRDPRLSLARKFYQLALKKKTAASLG